MIRINFQATIDPSTVRTAVILQSFQYKLEDLTDLDMKLMTYNTFYMPNGCKSLYVQGDMNLHQQAPFQLGKLKREIFYDSDKFSTFLVDNEITDFVGYILAKNVSISIDPYIEQIIPSQASINENGGTFEMEMDIQIPNWQEIQYVPSVLVSL